MKIISFAWTTEALLKGKKTATRRLWKNSYAQMFKLGDICQAYDHNPRCGGRRIGLIKLTCYPFKQRLSKMTMRDIKEEGGLWKSVKEFQDMMGGPLLEVWVLKFKLLSRVSQGGDN